MKKLVIALCFLSAAFSGAASASYIKFSVDSYMDIYDWDDYYIETIWLESEYYVDVETQELVGATLSTSYGDYAFSSKYGFGSGSLWAGIWYWGHGLVTNYSVSFKALSGSGHRFSLSGWYENHFPRNDKYLCIQDFSCDDDALLSDVSTWEDAEGGEGADYGYMYDLGPNELTGRYSDSSTGGFWEVDDIPNLLKQRILVPETSSWLTMLVVFGFIATRTAARKKS
ncbi:hypothetical protein ACFSJ3_00635 [Corallincola platygyrae]|uniref:PEP-CTERM sorting domain-containing protein n=1 Tax=Corallincola platygyrae TaxID=1193278 RepID=A0ABW4XG64_9GAMM